MMLTRRLAESFAMMMIGDGLLGVVEPRRHVGLWRSGPGWWQAMVDPFARHPGMTRWVGAAEAAAGLWLASCANGPAKR